MANMSVKTRVESIDHHVGKRLRMRRIMMGLSQHDLGVAVNVSIQQIQKYEKAINRISSGKLHNFSKLLKVPVSYFFDDMSNEDSGGDSALAEEPQAYVVDEHATEREVVSLIKYFNSIQDTSVRKKVVDIAKTLANSNL